MGDVVKTSTIVPAPAGWYVRYFIKGGDTWPAYLSLEPIIAWEIDREDRPYHYSANRPSWDRCVSHITTPILLEGECSNPFVTQDPAGILHHPEGETFANEAEAIAYLEELELKEPSFPERVLAAAREAGVKIPENTDASVHPFQPRSER